MKKSAFLMVIVALCAGQHASAFVNFNTGFESGSLTPWYQGNDYSNPGQGVGWQVTSSDAHSGLYSATCTGNIELRQDFAPVLDSQISDVSLWIKHPNVPSISAFFFWYSDLTSNSTTLDLNSTDWESFDLTGYLLTDPGKALVGVSVYGCIDFTSPAAETFVDDFQIVATPEPTTCSLLFLGLSGFLLRRYVGGSKPAR